MAAAIGLLSLQLAGGQTFDVASVKPATPSPGRVPPRIIRGGPGSTDPGSVTLQNVDLFSLLTMAYDIKAYQLSGPDWLRTAKFDLAAKVAAGATVEQYRRMLQSLLVERFKLVVHFEKKESKLYELVVAKNGPKFKETPAETAALDDGLQPPATATAPIGYTGPINIDVRRGTMEKLAGFLSGLVGQPVIDKTGLPGRYDFLLSWSGIQTGVSAGSEAPPTPFDALQAQLGLKLTPQKGMIDILVIDHVEKAPTEN